ncbi:AraC family transcriptional regulator [Flavitalea sp. BT771]|uniref:helix-turn-helix transcriptional regulator n=1 Tax=Flavitalea sp. BT771 TaxID=3063329 RepID=UPI0026E36084|nr:AraC family transcriptional regulator [Flavitalea sp. BT771]MDO6432323.1 AraC family transcriptional regulator [Flavitalea sp. BT771]MDV6221233.1 AraC family transcriptional regulator [Flavitalea sp. BT771]
MNSYLLQQGRSKELELFPHIIEFGSKKIQTIQFNSFPVEKTAWLRAYYVLDGRYDWIIDGMSRILYPGDLALILPEQSFGGARELLDIGAFFWIALDMNRSYLSTLESRSIQKILLLNDSPVIAGFKEGGHILQLIGRELSGQEIGFQTRINHLTDTLLILIARQLTKQNNSQRDFPRTFMKLEQELRDNLSHQWTVEEMAALVGLGTTAFTEKVKSFTGFSPISYLINIRISEAIKLLKRTDINLTDVALDTGFYSSQHFSTTFKKLTGYTPSQFRKNNTDNL